jgi:hypothetical protein
MFFYFTVNRPRPRFPGGGARNPTTKTKSRTAPKRRPSVKTIPRDRAANYDKSRSAFCGLVFACANIAVPA